MKSLKEIFENAENGTLTYEQFKQATNGMKLVDLKEGGYIDQNKHAEEVANLKEQIETLNSTIAARDGDLETLKQQLTDAGTDVEKLNTLSTEFANLQGKYEEDVKNYKAQLKRQSYEFAVKDFANSKKFTSNAAKRDFINSMIAKELKMDDGKILGAEDFVATYSADNADAFYVEEEPEQETYSKPKPMFVSSTQGPEQEVDRTGGFSEAFNFTGIRSRDD